MSGLQLLNPLAELRHTEPAWGIDPGTKKYVITAILPGGEYEQRVIPMPTGDEHRRLSAAYEVLVRAFISLRADLGPPLYVSMEQPFAMGRKVHPQSFYFVGVGLTALGTVLGWDGAVETIGPPVWKKAALGDGNGGRKKPEVLAWAQGLGLQDECAHCRSVVQENEGGGCKKQGEAHDKADSLGLAVAAARHAA